MLRDVETTPPRHVTGSKPEKPIELKLVPRTGSGSIDVTINQDGTYHFSGKMPRPKEFWGIDVVIAMIDNRYHSFVFEYIGASGKWSKKGTNTALKDNFKSFLDKYWYGGTYSYVSPKPKTKHWYKACSDVAIILLSSVYYPPITESR
jgi:hypothetical protein